MPSSAQDLPYAQALRDEFMDRQSDMEVDEGMMARIVASKTPNDINERLSTQDDKLTLDERVNKLVKVVRANPTPSQPASALPTDNKSSISKDPIYIKVEKRLQEKQKELADHIGKVESNTLDITTTTAALKNRTEELAQKQDEILKQIMMLAQSQ